VAAVRRRVSAHGGRRRTSLMLAAPRAAHCAERISCTAHRTDIVIWTISSRMRATPRLNAVLSPHNALAQLCASRGNASMFRRLAQPAPAPPYRRRALISRHQTRASGTGASRALPSCCAFSRISASTVLRGWFACGVMKADMARRHIWRKIWRRKDAREKG